MSSKRKPLSLLSRVLRAVFGNAEAKHSTLPTYTRSINPDSPTLNGVVCYNEYGGYFTPFSSQHRPAVRKIHQGKVHEPDTIAFIRAHCQGGDVIHAGAFFGDFLPGISSALVTGAKLWAFEPNPENYSCAQITCLINQLDNVNLFHAGLGDRQTTMAMTIKSAEGESLGGASFITGKDIQGETTEINLVKIDDIIPSDRRISILQLDVEGYEKQALGGALETISRHKPLLILEDHVQQIDSDWFDEHIKSLGYKPFTTLHGNSVYKA